MASLSSGPRINARTTRRIHLAIKRVGLIMTANGLRFQGRDISSECITSAVLYAFLELPEAKQEAFLRDILPKLEAELNQV